MIYVDRNSVKAPPVLRSPKAEKAFAEAKEFYACPLTSRLQERHRFRMDIWKEAKPALRELFKGKCVYCESTIAAVASGDVEMFRPKAGAINQSGKFDPEHYWWLTYEWSNLYLSCQMCNMSKGSRFPVAGPRAEVPQGDRAELGAPWYIEDLKKEKALLLDPCAEGFDTDQHLLFHAETGAVAGLTREGKTTIEIVDLNRAGLKEARKLLLRETASLLEFIGKFNSLESEPGSGALPPRVGKEFAYLKGLQDPSKQYAGAQRQIIRRWFHEQEKARGSLQGIKAKLLWGEAESPGTESVEAAEGAGQVSRPVSAKRAARIISKAAEEKQARLERKARRASLNPQHITRIEMRNFRVIEELVLDFPPPQEEQAASWLVLLGENGVGKSSVLKAVALALTDEEDYAGRGFEADKILRIGSRSGYVRVHMTDYPEPFEVRFDEKGFRKSNKNKLQTYFFGYGGSRLLPQAGHKPAAADGVARTENLFDPFLPLTDARKWLLSLKRKPFGYSALALKDLLVREDRDRLFRRRGLVKLRLADFGTGVPLAELSDGYQSVVALVADILSVMLETWPTADKSQGIVLIDELDVHLHPRWKVEIVSRLRRVFPRVQFIATTHDPLCLLGTRPGEVHVLHRDAASERVVATQFDVPAGARADQILTGFWFGLPSTLDRGTLRLPDDYYELTRARRTPTNSRRLRDPEEELRARLGNFAETSVDRMAQSVAAEILREDYLTWNPRTRAEKRAEIKERVSRKLGRGGRAPATKSRRAKAARGRRGRP